MFGFFFYCVVSIAIDSIIRDDQDVINLYVNLLCQIREKSIKFFRILGLWVPCSKYEHHSFTSSRLDLLSPPKSFIMLRAGYINSLLHEHIGTYIFPIIIYNYYYHSVVVYVFDGVACAYT